MNSQTLFPSDTTEKVFNLTVVVAALGYIASCSLSQWLRSRKQAFAAFYAFCTLVIFAYLNMYNVSSAIFYSTVFLLGFSVGFWALFVTNASEQFGTNLRATSAISVPNFARGSLVPIAWIYNQTLTANDGNMLVSFMLVGGGVMLVTFITLYFVNETFAKDLDFYER